MAKRRSSTSKSARRRANQSLKQRQHAEAQSSSSDFLFDEESSVATHAPPTARKSAARIKVEIPQPHPKADPDAALNAVAAYRQELNQWKRLPFWKRLVTPRPQHPTGI